MDTHSLTKEAYRALIVESGKVSEFLTAEEGGKMMGFKMIFDENRREMACVLSLRAERFRLKSVHQQLTTHELRFTKFPAFPS